MERIIKQIHFSQSCLGMKKDKVELIAPKMQWSECFEKLNSILKLHLNIKFHHIGSTSIPGLWAKPILDILGVIEDEKNLDGDRTSFEQLGFTWKGEYGITGRRYLTLYNEDQSIGYVHLHLFSQNNPAVESHLQFRNCLRSDAMLAKEYNNLKLKLGREFRMNRSKYTEGKNAFIQRVLEK